MSTSHPPTLSLKIQVQAEAERRGLIGQIESRTHELKSMQEAFMTQLQSAQREIGFLKQALLTPAASSAVGRQEQLAEEISSLRAEIEYKASAASSRLNETMKVAEDTTHRIVEMARGDSVRLSSEYFHSFTLHCQYYFLRSLPSVF